MNFSVWGGRYSCLANKMLKAEMRDEMEGDPAKEKKANVLPPECWRRGFKAVAQNAACESK